MLPLLALKAVVKDGLIKPLEAIDLLDDDVKEKIAWAVTSANAVSEWKNPEEEEVWK